MFTSPVERGLCERPQDWEWSSFRHYATGCDGRVEIEPDGRREHANHSSQNLA